MLDQSVTLRGQAIVHARPAIAANWRLEPNLSGDLSLGDSGTNIAGVRINLANEARPFINRTMNEQIAALQARVRNDPFIERAAREQWAKMCRSIPLGGGGTGLPALWLEMKPVRAAAAQPQVDARNLTLTIGMQAETRIVPAATKPACPFPATAGAGAADGERQDRRRRADRRALHRAQQASRSAAQGSALSRRTRARRSRSRCARPASPPPATAC